MESFPFLHLITKQKIMKRLLLLALVACSFTNCNKAENYFENMKPAETASMAMDGEAGGSFKESAAVTDQSSSEERSIIPVAPNRVIEKVPAQIIKNAGVEFQVKDIDASHTKISALLKQYNAYFGSDNKTNNSYRIDNSMSIRVPAKNFETLLEELMKESVYTNYKNITAEDVTAEFVDTEARLKTKREVEARYSAILKQANKVSDILEVEDKLRVIREEIEATEGRLKLLRDQVGYSTITLNIYQKLDYTPEPEIGFFSNLKEAFVRGWRSLVDVAIGIVRIWPFVIIWVVVMVFVYRRWMRKK